MARKEKKCFLDAHIAITTFNLFFFTIAILVLSYKVHRLEKAQLLICGTTARGETVASRQPDVAGKTKNINNNGSEDETARRVIGEERRPDVRRRVKRHESFYRTMQTVACVRLCQSTLVSDFLFDLLRITFLKRKCGLGGETLLSTDGTKK